MEKHFFLLMRCFGHLSEGFKAATAENGFFNGKISLLSDIMMV